ncbi:MAG: glycosyltransferase [Candidatus Woesebacteria bacterium]|jgi:glycosyltransferase involved in cell wall biosynthesis
MKKKFKKTLKVALVHDFLREYGGAERVLEALHEIFPKAPVYTAFFDKKALGIHWQVFKDWDLRQTWLSKIPLIKKIYSPLRFLAPKAFADLDLSDFDLVISSSNAFEAKAVLSKNRAIYNDASTHDRKPVHICYCHTPPRALYGYSTMSSWKKNPVIHFFGNLINHYMRIIDYQLAQKVDYFIANSEEVKKRIKKFYRRDSTVINPPVNVEKNFELVKKLRANLKQKQLSSKTEKKIQDYYLFISRLGLQKHPELAVQACKQLELPLKLAGTGQMLRSLKEIAGPTIEFLGAVTEQELVELYLGAKALLYPVEDEDFGIVPVEAMAYGLPVIAHRSGGPQETILEGKTGLFFNELNVKSLIASIKKFEKSDHEKFNPQRIHQHASQFNKRNFQKKILAFMNRIIEK